MKRQKTDIKKIIKKKIELRHQKISFIEKRNFVDETIQPNILKSMNERNRIRILTNDKTNKLIDVQSLSNSDRTLLRAGLLDKPYEYISSKELIEKIDMDNDRLQFIILGGNLDKSPFVPVMKMAMELYENDEKYKNSILIFAYNRGEPFNEFKKLCPNKRIIIYQFEQLYNNLSQWYNPHSNVPHIKRRTEQLNGWFKNVDEIWEYDLNNLMFLKSMGFNNVKHMPLKYANSLKRINNNCVKDIDVLFYGQVKGCERRKEIIEKISQKHNIIIVPYGTTGDKLYQYVDRSKIVLNIHFYESGIQEQVRIFELLINNKCVLSERSKINYFGDLITECDKDEIVNKIDFLLKNDNWKLFNNVGKLYKNNVFSRKLRPENKKIKKVLVTITNFSDKQLEYLNRQINELKKINKNKYLIDIFVHSNIPIERDDVTTILHKEPPVNGWNWLPWENRKTIYLNKENYDLFLYTENDHLYTEKHLDSFLEITKVLPENLIAGFIQFEEFPQYDAENFIQHIMQHMSGILIQLKK